MTTQLLTRRSGHSARLGRDHHVWPVLFRVAVAGSWIVPAASAGTIAEIALMPEGGHAVADEVVILSTVDLVPDPSVKSFQVRDNTRAMTVYGTTAEIDAALTGFDAGDVIEIAGYTSRLDGSLILTTGGTVGGFAVSGRTSTLPVFWGAFSVSPPDIAAAYESQLVCLQNVSFEASGGAGVFAAESNYALAGTSTLVRIATADLGLAGQSIPSGPVNITGVVIPDPDGNGYVLAPRGMGDIVPEPATLGLLILGVVGLVQRQTPDRPAPL